MLMLLIQYRSYLFTETNIDWLDFVAVEIRWNYQKHYRFINETIVNGIMKYPKLMSSVF